MARRCDPPSGWPGGLMPIARGQRLQQPGDLLQTQDDMGGTARQRGLGHQGSLCGIGVLNDCQAAGAVDGFEPVGAVLVPSGQDDAEQALAVHVGRGFEQHVDRRPREVHHLVGRQREGRSAIDQQVVVGRRDIDRAGLDRLLVLRFLDRPPAMRRKDLRQQARALARQVQHDEARHPQCGGQRGQQRAERLNPARRCADDDGLDVPQAASSRVIGRRAAGRCDPARRPCRTRRHATRTAASPWRRGRGSPCGQSASRNRPSARSCSSRSK